MAFDRPRGVSLHVGLNSADSFHYRPWFTDLVSAEADALAMYAMAREAGFEARYLLGPGATREHVGGRVLAHAAELGRGDLLLVSFSGHGGWIPSAPADEGSRMNSTWCLYDGQMRHDELLEMWGAFVEGVRIVVVSDSCHSGSVIEGLPPALGPRGPQPRALLHNTARSTYAAHRDFYESIRPRRAPRVVASVRQLVACLEHENAYEDATHGYFTAALLHVWANGTFSGTYEELMNRITAQVIGQRPRHQTLGAEPASNEPALRP